MKILPKIAVVGPESTGKSTLSRQLASHYHTYWVEEFARYYLDCLPRTYQEEDLVAIARGQLSWELVGNSMASRLTICDTNLLVVYIWSMYKYGKVDDWIIEHMKLDSYHLHLLTYIDTTWQEDPQREHPDPKVREELFSLYHKILLKSKVPFHIIRGEEEERFFSAVRAINNCI